MRQISTLDYHVSTQGASSLHKPIWVNCPEKKFKLNTTTAFTEVDASGVMERAKSRAYSLTFRLGTSATYRAPVKLNVVQRMGENQTLLHRLVVLNENHNI